MEDLKLTKLQVKQVAQMTTLAREVLPEKAVAMMESAMIQKLKKGKPGKAPVKPRRKSAGSSCPGSQAAAVKVVKPSTPVSPPEKPVIPKTPPPPASSWPAAPKLSFKVVESEKAPSTDSSMEEDVPEHGPKGIAAEGASNTAASSSVDPTALQYIPDESPEFAAIVLPTVHEFRTALVREMSVSMAAQVFSFERTIVDCARLLATEDRRNLQVEADLRTRQLEEQRYCMETDAAFYHSGFTGISHRLEIVSNNLWRQFGVTLDEWETSGFAPLRPPTHRPPPGYVPCFIAGTGVSAVPGFIPGTGVGLRVPIASGSPHGNYHGGQFREARAPPTPGRDLDLGGMSLGSPRFNAPNRALAVSMPGIVGVYIPDTQPVTPHRPGNDAVVRRDGEPDPPPKS